METCACSQCRTSGLLPQVEPPVRGDALRSLRMTDSSGTSLWWRSYVCAHLPHNQCCEPVLACSMHMLGIAQEPTPSRNIIRPGFRPLTALWALCLLLSMPALPCRAATGAASPWTCTGRRGATSCGASQTGRTSSLRTSDPGSWRSGASAQMWGLLPSASRLHSAHCRMLP